MRSSDRACALTQYELRRPDARSTIASDVAEIFTVKAGKIDSLSIYFDRAPFRNSLSSRSITTGGRNQT